MEFESRQCPGCDEAIPKIALKCRSCGLESINSATFETGNKIDEIESARQKRFNELNRPILTQSSSSTNVPRNLLLSIGAIAAFGVLISAFISGSGGLSKNDQFACRKFATIEKKYMWKSVEAGFNQAEIWKVYQDYSDELENLISSDLSSELKNALYDDALSYGSWIRGAELTDSASKFCGTDWTKG